MKKSDDRIKMKEELELIKKCYPTISGCLLDGNFDQYYKPKKCFGLGRHGVALQCTMEDGSYCSLKVCILDASSDNPDSHPRQYSNEIEHFSNMKKTIDNMIDTGDVTINDLYEKCSIVLTNKLTVKEFNDEVLSNIRIYLKCYKKYDRTSEKQKSVQNLDGVNCFDFTLPCKDFWVEYVGDNKLMLFMVSSCRIGSMNSKDIVKKLKSNDFVQCAYDVLRGLHALYSIGYEHRDIHLGNILVGEMNKKYYFQIIDFAFPSYKNTFIDKQIAGLCQWYLVLLHFIVDTDKEVYPQTGMELLPDIIHKIELLQKLITGKKEFSYGYLKNEQIVSIKEIGIRIVKRLSFDRLINEVKKALWGSIVVSKVGIVDESIVEILCDLENLYCVRFKNYDTKITNLKQKLKTFQKDDIAHIENHFKECNKDILDKFCNVFNDCTEDFLGKINRALGNEQNYTLQMATREYKSLPKRDNLIQDLLVVFKCVKEKKERMENVNDGSLYRMKTIESRLMYSVKYIKELEEELEEKDKKLEEKDKKLEEKDKKLEEKNQENKRLKELVRRLQSEKGKDEKK